MKIGIIGGSGLDNLEFLNFHQQSNVPTHFGSPSDAIIEGSVKGVNCALLARHGRPHSIMPGNVNYRANILALKQIGCTHIIATTACGSLKNHIHPGDIVVLDSFIDRTTKRQCTFYDGTNPSFPGICHMPMEPAFCNKSRNIIIDCLKELNLRYHPTGTCVTIEGPRFSSMAESKLYKSWDADVINMTTVPEVVLAKEAGLCYAAIGIVTDYDCWKGNESVVNVQDVIATFKTNINLVKELLLRTVEEYGRCNWTDTINSLKSVVQSNIMCNESPGTVT